MANKQIIVLCGEYGSGKSTLANLLKTSTSETIILENCNVINYILNILGSQDEMRLRNMLAQCVDEQFLRVSPIKTIIYQEEVGDGVIETAFAIPLKRIINALFDIDYNVLLGVGDARIQREQFIECKYSRTQGMNCRVLMEYMANSVIKQEYGESIFADILFTQLETYKASTIIISDLRYTCEFIRIPEHANVFRIERPGVPIASQVIKNFVVDVIYNTGEPIFMKNQLLQKMKIVDVNTKQCGNLVTNNTKMLMSPC